MHLEHGFSLSTLAHNLRRFERFHRVCRWFRRSVLHGLIEGLLEWARWAFSPCERFGPPLRVFSVYQALRTGYPKINGRIILHDQGSPRFCGNDHRPSE